MKLLLILIISLTASFAQAAEPFSCLELTRKIITSHFDPNSSVAINFKKKWLQISVDNPFDNRQFIKNVLEQKEGRLYFQTENAVLKELNDKIIKDKDLVTALDTHLKYSLFEKLQKFPLLNENVSSHYTDFKSLRLEFNVDTPEIRRQLATLHEELMEEFKHTVDGLGFNTIYESTGGLTKSPLSWYLSGVGRTNDEANFATRLGRPLFNPRNPNHKLSIIEFKNNESFFYRYLQDIKDTYSEIYKKAPQLFEEYEPSDELLKNAPELANTFAGTTVLKQDLIDILRKVKATNLEEYTAYCQRRIKERFSFEAPELLIYMLKDYYNKINYYSPSLLIEERILINMGLSQHGAISVDIAGMGARNAKTLMASLNLVDLSKNSNDILNVIRDSEVLATHELDELRKTIMDGLKTIERRRVTPSRKRPAKELTTLQYTGDDMIYFPRGEDISLDEKLEFMLHLAREGQGDNYRVVFLPQNDIMGNAIDQLLRADYISRAEGLEKSLRLEIEQIFDYKDTKKMTFAIDTYIQNPGIQNFRILVGQQDGLDQVSAEIIEEIAKKIIEEENLGNFLGLIKVP